MIDDYGISFVQMAENAGRNLADLARKRFLFGDPRDRTVVVLAGMGGNGAGGLVCARRLYSWGAAVEVITTGTDQGYRGVPAHQLGILRRMRVPVTPAFELDFLPEADLYIDALVGYNLSGAPRDTVADLIRWSNAASGPTLSLDVPTGVDASTGKVYRSSIRAKATMTMALAKKGLLTPAARSAIGELYLADISVPPELYAGPGLDLFVGSIFAQEDIIRIW
jgi:NAD(P)H-hydrate epimerase